jgi:prevent-host-death family protein
MMTSTFASTTTTLAGRPVALAHRRRSAACYAWSTAGTITQRELRNASAAVMDAVEAGETILVTRNGTPVAELRPARRRRSVPTAELIRNEL